MKSTELQFSLIDTYLSLLDKLSPENKLALIAKLSDSLNGPKKPISKLKDSFGAFQSAKTADELIHDIKNSRNFNRNTEVL